MMVPGMSNSLQTRHLRLLEVVQLLCAVTLGSRKRSLRALRRLKSTAGSREARFARDQDALPLTAPQELVDSRPSGSAGEWSSAPGRPMPALSHRTTHGGCPRARASTRSGISTNGISPRSTAPESRMVIRRVGGGGGRLGGGEPSDSAGGGDDSAGGESGGTAESEGSEASTEGEDASDPARGDVGTPRGGAPSDRTSGPIGIVR